MKLSLPLIVAIAALLFSTAGLRAQTYEAGLIGGASTYIGDMNPYNTPIDLIQKPGPAFGGFLRYNHTRHLSLRFNLLYAGVSGSAVNSPYPLAQDDPESFSTAVAELSLFGEVNFLPYSAGDPDTPYAPYIFGGTGGFVFKKPGDDNHKFRRLSYVLGAGFKFYITNQLSGGIDVGMRSTTTDQLDGIYGDSGNPKVNDWYSFAGVSIAIRFRDRSSAICPY